MNAPDRAHAPAKAVFKWDDPLLLDPQLTGRGGMVRDGASVCAGKAHAAHPARQPHETFESR